MLNSNTDIIIKYYIIIKDGANPQIKIDWYIRIIWQICGVQSVWNDFHRLKVHYLIISYYFFSNFDSLFNNFASLFNNFLYIFIYSVSFFNNFVSLFNNSIFMHSSFAPYISYGRKFSSILNESKFQKP